jgi:hypothetical protein
LRFSSDYLPKYIHALDSTLFNLAETAPSDHEQGRVYDSLRFMRQRRIELEGAFFSALDLGFKKFSAGETLGYHAEGELNFEKLTLLQNDELEESIAISSVGHKAENHYIDLLYGIMQRLSVIRGGDKVNEENNPLGPLHFCYYLRSALTPVEFDIKPKVVAYKIFAREFVSQLGALYTDINQYLVTQGILPHLRPEYGQVRSNAAKTPMPEKKSPELKNESSLDQLFGSTDLIQDKLREISNELEDVVNQKLAGAVNPDESSYYPRLMVSIEQLQGQLNQHLSSLDPGGSGQFIQDEGIYSANFIEYKTEDIIASLSAFQSQASELRLAYTPKSVWEPIQRESVRHQLKEQLIKAGIEAKKRIPSADLTTIDLVGMLFDFMLDDPTIPDSVKALMSHLHTPYLKVSILDKNFFKQMQHPARVLLEKLSEAGSHFVDPGGGKDQEVYDKIEKVIARILREYKSDTRLFAELLLDFNGFMNKLKRRSEILERRAVEKAKGEDKLKEVKKVASDEIHDRVDSLNLPTEVSLLLLQPWSDYLTFILLRYGDKSGAWTQALKTVDDIVWSVQPKKARSEKNRLSELIGELEVSVLRGLETIGYEQSQSQILVNKLKEYQHQALNDQLKAQDTEEQMRLQQAKQQLRDQHESLDELSAEEKRVMDRLSVIEFGTQFLFHKSIMGRAAKLKVAWYNDNTQHYMFVDQLGKKVAVKSSIELAKAVVKGDIEILHSASKPLVERALESIFKTVSKTIDSVKDKR